MRRHLRNWAGLALAFFTLTCTDHGPTGPGRRGATLLDLSAFQMSAPGDPPVPFDTVRITVRRTTDELILADIRRPFAAFAGANSDSARFTIEVDMERSVETVAITVALTGANGTWYSGSTTATLTAGATATPAPLLLSYVGLGFDADSVRIQFSPVPLVGGSFRTMTAAVWVPGGILTGVPVGYRVADPNVVTLSNQTLNAVRVTGAVPVRDSTWVYAETPTHLRDSIRVAVIPPAAQLVKESGDNQSTTVGAPLAQPLCVKAVDALGGAFPGLTVTWTVVSGTATLSAPTSLTDANGLACVGVTPQSLGGLSVEASAPGLTPRAFALSAISGTIRQVIITPSGPDTIARGATLQYSAALRDSLGNPVPGTASWSSTVATVATVSPSGLATATGGDSTRIIALAGGYADTAWLFVRAVRSVAVTPADTVITAVDDSVTLSAAALDNFGAPVTSGIGIKFFTATPTVAAIVNAMTGRVRLVGPGNAVVVARDTISGVQGTATLRVNQRPAAVVNTPADSIQVGVGGRGQIVAIATDRNNHPIPAQTFGWTSRATAVASVDATGMVTGVALGQTWVVDSLVDPIAGVLRDSTLVSVVPTPPARIQWAYDSTAVGHGGSLAVAVSLTRPASPTSLIVKLGSSDTLIARTTVRTVVVPQGQAATSVTITGLTAGRVTLVAQDSSGLGYAPDTMVVTVVSTIEFREPGSFNRQTYFYLNNNQTRRAQVFLSDPAPWGGLGVTFVYGSPGKSIISPSPAIIPAGQLSADVVITGTAAGRDSVIPTSGGFVGQHAIVTVAPESLQLVTPYPYNGVVGLGQKLEPYVAFTYAMDHPLTVSISAAPAIATHPDTIVIPTGFTYQYFPIYGTALGSATVTVSAPGWVSKSMAIRVSTPRLQAFGSTSMVAGDPNPGYWDAYTADSLFGAHEVMDTVRVTAVSRNTAAVVIDSAVGRVLPNTYYFANNPTMRALAGAGGDSAWIVLSAPGYLPDSFKVYVQRPALYFQIGYPYDGRVPEGTLFQQAGYLQIPYARPDTFWVALSHSQRSVLGGPDSVAILPGTTYSYFDVQGNTRGVDTIGVARATGYVVTGGPYAYRVDRPRVRPYNYPSTLYTISPPSYVTAVVEDSLNGQPRPLLAPLTVTLVSRNPAAFTLDSTTVTIAAGDYISGRDTLRVVGVDTAGSRVVASAPNAASDSSNPIRVLPTPLQLSLGYPYSVSQGLVLPGSRVYVVGGNAPDDIKVALSHTNPAGFALGADTVLIPRGQSQSVTFDITGLDSIGTDTIVASAPGYVTHRATMTTQASRLNVSEPGANHLTTDAPQRLITYTETRNGFGLNPAAPVTYTIVSSNPAVVQIDSAGFVNATGDTATATVPASLYYGYFKVRYVGSGTARLHVFAPGFDRDSTQLITVTGPTLHFSYSNITIGQGQIFTSQRVYVGNPVATPLTVRLLRSDSLLPPANRIFSLLADSVVIAAGQTYSPFFDVTGTTVGAANLIARATGYSQATATVSVGMPQLAVSTNAINLYVGQRPYNLTTYAEDQIGNIQVVAAPLVVTSASSDPTIARSDSASRSIATRDYSTFFPLRPFKKGGVEVVFSAPGYKPDTTVVTVDTAKLQLSAPGGLGAGQQISNGMNVSLPYTTDSLLVVSITSTNPGVLSVPALDTIVAGASSASFTIAGVAPGTASVIVTAPHSLPDTQPVVVGTPNLFVSLTANTNAGQQYTVTVFARDSVGNTRAVTAPLSVSLSSSNPSRTVFTSSNMTIAAGQSSASTSVRFDTAGSYTVTAAAAAYNAGGATTTTTGAMIRIQGTPTQAFVPPSVTIPVGRVVTWRNEDGVAHTSTGDGATPAWNSGNIAATTGQYQRTFTTAGTFPYHCAIHPGMTGTIVVQ